MQLSNIGIRLREERERLGYNQADFGALGGVKKQAQLKYEKGERDPDASYLEGIATAGADVQYIIAGSRMSSDDSIAEQAAVYGMPPEDRAKHALRLASTVSKEMGLDLTAEQMQALVGFAYTIPTVEAVRQFIKEAYAMFDKELPNK